MANDDHIAQLKKGVTAWNAWRDENPEILPNLREAELTGVDLSGANLGVSEANLHRAYTLSVMWRDLRLADLISGRADLSRADLSDANLSKADLRGADLSEANLSGANLSGANLSGANLRRADLSLGSRAELRRRDRVRGGATSWADFIECTTNLSGADLTGADLEGANLSDASLTEANLRGTNLKGANLSRAFLFSATLVDTDLTDADLTGCNIYGVSAWNLKLEKAKQQNLVITPPLEPEITVDNIEVAQFVYLLLHNEKIRDVIDTVGKKGVLLLGRFTEGRIEVLERLREKLRSLGFVPMVFNFDKPETKDFTETVRLLANLSRFVIVDITNPRSAPLELQAVVPDYMVPFAPILQDGEESFAMFVDLQRKYNWVLDVIRYPSVDRLIEGFEDKIVRRAEAKFNELLARRTEQLRVEDV
jgi:uncharacterized protein YjbI with pentapeptide repeats